MAGREWLRVYRSLHAVAIGVGRYADPQHDLGYARSDAEFVAEVLESEFGFDHVRLLLDAEATRAGIQACFEDDLQQVHEDDGVLIFFAGHGVTTRDAFGNDRGFLVPHDGDPARPMRNNVSVSHLRDEWLPLIPAKHAFLVVDACYGGLALRDVQAAARPRSVDEAVIVELTRRDRKVRQLLSAGGRGQRVLDGGLFGRSVFTGRFVEALREADPYALADHVGVLVKERVAQDSAERGHVQTPAFGYVFGGDGTFVFRRRAPRGSTAVSPRVEVGGPRRASGGPVPRSGEGAGAGLAGAHGADDAGARGVALSRLVRRFRERFESAAGTGVVTDEAYQRFLEKRQGDVGDVDASHAEMMRAVGWAPVHLGLRPRAPVSITINGATLEGVESAVTFLAPAGRHEVVIEPQSLLFGVRKLTLDLEPGEAVRASASLPSVMHARPWLSLGAHMLWGSLVAVLLLATVESQPPDLLSNPFLLLLAPMGFPFALPLWSVSRYLRGVKVPIVEDGGDGGSFMVYGLLCCGLFIVVLLAAELTGLPFGRSLAGAAFGVAVVTGAVTSLVRWHPDRYASRW